MNFLIAGGTGLIGTALIDTLVKQNHTVYCLTRSLTNKKQSTQVHYIEWLNNNSPRHISKKIDVVINLAGLSLNSGYWTKKRKRKLMSSRLQTTKELLTIMEHLPQKPSLFLNASAVGIYGTSVSNVCTEDTVEGNDFLANIVKKWEACAKKASSIPIRTVCCRFGVVLSNQGGALPLLTLPFKFFIGGNMGNGEQWVSWIHIQDLVQAILFIIDTPSISGPVNFTAPSPIQMNELGEQISTILHRPKWLTIPSPLLKSILGEKSILILEGQKVIPSILLNKGYHFQYPSISKALKNIYH